MGTFRDKLHHHRGRVAASRVILMLLSALLVVMPITERYLTWDEFLQSGRDLEFTLLGLLLFCGFVALIAEQVIAPPLLWLLLAARRKLPSLREALQRALGPAMAVRLMGGDTCRPQRSPALPLSLRAMPLRI